MSQTPRWFFPALFFFSGFTALVFETVWSQYLRTLLGHSAYAQSVVLILFMGGMAIGAWLSSKFSTRIPNMLRLYALVEGTIGVLGITFDPVFRQSTTLSFDIAIPMLDSGPAIEIYKWIICSFLILPQTILLGMTFPTMANSAIRNYPGSSGQLIGVLYFSNSAGAALGALASAFVFIKYFGLPGSIMTAGIINVLIALCAYLFSGQSEPAPITPTRKPQTIPTRDSLSKLLLWCVAITGTASFMYEVTWIRMLSMVIGSAFHSFEIMLSAFITGLALGGLWIRLRINYIQDKVLYLAFVQLLMGLLAIFSLYLYNYSFEIMSVLLQELQRNDEGYLTYNLSSHAIAFMIMLPATTLAGMTLPLITSLLIDRGEGEKSIGQVYAANTLGSIVGVLFAVHIGFTTLGIKGLIVSGGILDIAIGWALLSTIISRPVLKKRSLATAMAISVISIGISIANEPSIPYMTSAVFRDGQLDTANRETIFRKDGKSASISVTRTLAGHYSIATNGKPDASIDMTNSGIPSLDEYTMTMTGAIPILLKPDAEYAAVIGLGSGLTSDVLLGSPAIKTLDTIEIEKQMVIGAHQFKPRVSRVFNDPRSHIIIDDARTYLARSKFKYDLIVSEPSNPWVSGVASLFTEEFYRDVKKHLNDDGLFVQWIHGYEISNQLIASIINAFSPHYSDYTIYAGASSDLIIVLAKNGVVPELPDRLPQYSELRSSLEAIGFTGMKDIAPFYIAGKPIIDAVTRIHGAAINSDYYPILQIHAPKQMFLKTNARMMLDIVESPLPINAYLGTRKPVFQGSPIDHNNLIGIKRRFDALAIINTLLENNSKHSTTDTIIANRLTNLSSIFRKCRETDPSSSLQDMLWLAETILPNVEHREIKSLFTLASSCNHQINDQLVKAINLMYAISTRDIPYTIEYSRQYLRENWSNVEWNKYFVSAAMMGEAASGNHHNTEKLWRHYGSKYFGRTAPPYINLILSYSQINRLSKP